MSDENQGTAEAEAEAEPVVRTAVATRTRTQDEPDQQTRTRRLPPFHVIILNDEEHTFEYVIDLLIRLFAHNQPTAEALTWRIHHQGRAIVYTTHKEKAELKREQVLTWGPDPRMSLSKGSLGCYIEPAEAD